MAEKATRSVLAVAVAVLALSSGRAAATDYYVRQTVGDDRNDGLSAATAWRRVARLAPMMKAGDTAYVGPGLYREEIVVLNDGSPGRRLVLIADATGQHTGDPPGAVMITGADPIDEAIFAPHSAPGVFTAKLAGPLRGVVEMDGPQHRYKRARQTKEHLKDGVSEVDVVARQPSTFFHDERARVLYIHTSDGKRPSTHELEVIRRPNGIAMSRRHHVTVVGFTFRHFGDGGINFFKGSAQGVAIGNTSYGNRQGIRVYGATDILVSGNTLFRNENSGVYFAAGSTDGVAIGNDTYENIKGLRWSSLSSGAIAVDNVSFDNSEYGIALENATPAMILHNRLVHNRQSQLLVIDTRYSSENNCFESSSPEETTADFFRGERYAKLAEYQQAKHHDLQSQAGGCGSLPAKVDVARLHRESSSYVERARRVLGVDHPAPGATTPEQPAESGVAPDDGGARIQP
jgi:parallel beta-helix repeat protein